MDQYVINEHPRTWTDSNGKGQRGDRRTRKEHEIKAEFQHPKNTPESLAGRKKKKKDEVPIAKMVRSLIFGREIKDVSHGLKDKKENVKPSRGKEGKTRLGAAALQL